MQLISEGDIGDTLTAEETTGLQYAQQGDALFDLYASLFTGARAKWVDMVRDPANKKILADGRARLPVQDHAYWLGDMNPRETGRLLEAIDLYGSISQAAKHVPLSYKAAWDAVDAMNNLADTPLVERSTGGKAGGGTLEAHQKNMTRDLSKMERLP